MSTSSSPPLVTTGRAIAFIVLCAVVAVVVVLASTYASAPAGEPLAPRDGGAAEADRSQEGRSTKEGRSTGRGKKAPQYAERLDPPPLPEEDLWAMVPDEHRLQEIMTREFALAGGVDSPGTDPEGARAEVGDPGWAPRMTDELRQGFERRVLAQGVTLRRLECERGRCLLELEYDGMVRASERVEAIRAWLSEDVRCRAYTDGPSDQETPHLPEEQQIWFLCGEPEAR